MNELTVEVGKWPNQMVAFELLLDSSNRFTSSVCSYSEDDIQWELFQFISVLVFLFLVYLFEYAKKIKRRFRTRIRIGVDAYERVLIAAFSYIQLVDVGSIPPALNTIFTFKKKKRFKIEEDKKTKVNGRLLLVEIRRTIDVGHVEVVVIAAQVEPRGRLKNARVVEQAGVDLPLGLDLSGRAEIARLGIGQIARGNDHVRRDQRYDVG